MELEFDGLEEILKEIEQIENVTQDIADKALIAAGDILLDETKKQVYTVLDRRSGTAIESLVRTDPEDSELFVGTKGGVRQPGYYLYMQEFGFYNVRAGRFLSPKPFATIAFNNVKNRMIDEQLKVVRGELGM